MSSATADDVESCDDSDSILPIPPENRSYVTTIIKYVPKNKAAQSSREESESNESNSSPDPYPTRKDIDCDQTQPNFQYQEHQGPPTKALPTVLLFFHHITKL